MQRQWWEEAGLYDVIERCRYSLSRKAAGAHEIQSLHIGLTCRACRLRTSV